MVNIGGHHLQTIVIGDLMFFENSDKFKDEFNTIGYGPERDKPSTVEEMIACFTNLPFIIDVHKLHPLVGVLVTNKKKVIS